jgi:hypothetical protein
MPRHEPTAADRRQERADAKRYKAEAKAKRKQPSGLAPRRVSRVKRNEACPCGSNKKFKNCCFKLDALPVAELRRPGTPTPVPEIAAVTD